MKMRHRFGGNPGNLFSIRFSRIRDVLWRPRLAVGLLRPADSSVPHYKIV